MLNYLSLESQIKRAFVLLRMIYLTGLITRLMTK